MGQELSSTVSYNDVLNQSPEGLASVAKRSNFSSFVVEKIKEFGISGEVASELEENDIREHCGDEYTSFQQKQLCAAVRKFRKHFPASTEKLEAKIRASILEEAKRDCNSCCCGKAIPWENLLAASMAKTANTHVHSKSKSQQSQPGDSVDTAENEKEEEPKKQETTGETNDVYAIEQIVDDKCTKGEKRWLVKWLGYDASENTWEPKASFPDLSIIADYENEKKKAACANVENTKGGNLQHGAGELQSCQKKVQKPVPLPDSLREKYRSNFPLHEAAEVGQVDDAMNILNFETTDVNAKDDEGMTAVGYAAMWNHHEIISLLHRAGASLSVQDNDGDTPTIQAAYNNSPEALQLLLRLGANINTRNNDGKSALQYAVEKKYRDCAAILLDHIKGKEQPLVTHEEMTPYTFSARCSFDNTVVRAVKDEYGAYALHKSCGAGLLEEVNILIASGTDVEEPNGFGWTPLFYASSRNHPNVIEMLRKAGASLNKKMLYNGDTPTTVAAENDSSAALEYLVEHGADIHACNNAGNSALHCAARYNTNETVVIVNMLQEAGIGLDTQNKEGCTPVMLAAMHNSFRVLSALLHHGADFAIKSDAGKIALDYAEEKKHHKCTKILRLYESEKKSNKRQRTANGSTTRAKRSRRQTTTSMMR